MSGGVGQLLASVPHKSDTQLVYGGSVCEEPSRDAGRLLGEQGVGNGDSI